MNKPASSEHKYVVGFEALAEKIGEDVIVQSEGAVLSCDNAQDSPLVLQPGMRYKVTNEAMVKMADLTESVVWVVRNKLITKSIMGKN